MDAQNLLQVTRVSCKSELP